MIIFSNSFLGKWKKPRSDKIGVIFFLPPIGPSPEKIILELFKNLENIEIHRVPESIINSFKEKEAIKHPNLTIIEDRDNWDYVYEVETLKTLPGNRHRQNRRWLNKFLESYDYQFELLSEDLINKCKKLQLEWCVMRQCEEDEGLEQEQKAIYEALDNFSVLGFKGAILCVDQKCAGYTFGEMLNSNTLVIHVEKAHMQYDGGYQAIGNLFLNNVYSDVPFVNREQDLGIEGLRRAKESYKPIRMVKKSIIYRKD